MQGRREAGPCSGGRVHVGMPGLWVVVEGWGVWRVWRGWGLQWNSMRPRPVEQGGSGEEATVVSTSFSGLGIPSQENARSC